MIIHKNGYVLSNAHVAEDAHTKRCMLRKGSPANNYAWAELVFFPIGYNSDFHDNSTFRRDVAIWRITNSATDSPLPAEFPAFAIDENETITDGEKLETFSYPAELLSYSIILNSLYLVFSETTVQAHDNYFIQSIEGIGSQKGSSGGILIDPYTGRLVGMIFAVSDTQSKLITDRKTYSLTTYAINATVKSQTGMSINEYLATNP